MFLVSNRMNSIIRIENEYPLCFRGARDKRDSGPGLKRRAGDSRPQGVFARFVEFQKL